jgi:hypothetical protein
VDVRRLSSLAPGLPKRSLGSLELGSCSTGDAGRWKQDVDGLLAAVNDLRKLLGLPAVREDSPAHVQLVVDWLNLTR